MRRHACRPTLTGLRFRAMQRTPTLENNAVSSCTSSAAKNGVGKVDGVAAAGAVLRDQDATFVGFDTDRSHGSLTRFYRRLPPVRSWSTSSGARQGGRSRRRAARPPRAGGPGGADPRPTGALDRQIGRARHGRPLRHRDPLLARDGRRPRLGGPAAPCSTASVSACEYVLVEEPAARQTSANSSVRASWCAHREPGAPASSRCGDCN